MNVSSQTALALHRSMLRIRNVELRIEQLYHLDEMKTPVHLCIGQEAVAAGCCLPLGTEDYVSSNHRGHGHYLAKGGDLKAMIAELYCRRTGCSRGKGGSMHLVDTAVGHLGSSSIVGGGIPVSVGLGLAAKMQGGKRISMVFFGDGAADEGVLYESINFAVLKRLPVVFVYENNQFSVCSRVTARHPGRVIFHCWPDDRLRTAEVDGNAVLEVYEAAAAAVKRARAGGGPSFIECRTYRMRGHAGSGSEVELGYRTAEEVALWEARCPVARLRNTLLAENTVTEAELAAMEREIDEEIDEAFEFAQRSPLPPPSDVVCSVFRE